MKTVRGDSGALKRHKDRCTGFPATWTDVDVRCHFRKGQNEGAWECRHCSAPLTYAHKQHLASCPRLPEQDRRALDESEVARAAAGAGVYGSNPVYRDFEVTGWLVARCKACLKTVRGGGGSLKKHKDERCCGFPATWVEVDVASHFRKRPGDGRWECRHCGVPTARQHLCKSHMASCPRLPEQDRRALSCTGRGRGGEGGGWCRHVRPQPCVP